MKIKKLLSVFLAAVMLCGLFTPAFALSQTVPEGYTEIFTAEDLYNIRNDLDGKFILMNDIDLSVYENWEPIGTSEEPFRGELDGNGYQLKNLTIKNNLTEDVTYYYGLFGYISGAVIENIILVGCDLYITHSGEARGDCRIGGIAGYCNDSVISACTVLGKVCADGFEEAVVGGVIGRTKMAEISRCNNYAEVTVVNYKYAVDIFAGGVIGDLTTASTVCESSNLGAVSLVGKWENEYCYMQIGGVCGNCDDNFVLPNSVINCYNDGRVSTDFTNERTMIGGICGESYETQCVYNVGKIVVPEGFKGLAGAISGNIFHSWLTIDRPHYMTNAYYINENMIPSYDWENLPKSFDEKPFVNVKLLTEEEFKKQESFVGFDFENVWEMEEIGYPVFKNQPKVVAEKHNITLESGKNCSIGIANPIWETSDPIVVLMTEDGVIMAQSPGKAVLSVEYPYGYITEYYVTVTDPDFVNTPTPEPENKVESAEIVSLPLKNRIVFGVGSPNSPEGIVLKLKYKDGTEKTETIIRTDSGCYAGEESIIGGVHLTVVRFGCQEETLYVNDESVKVEYDYFVIPPISYILSSIKNIFHLIFKF